MKTLVFLTLCASIAACTPVRVAGKTATTGAKVVVGAADVVF